MRACAKTGIIALIDEATGFQKVRAQHALQLKLQAFIADELQDWARMFPDEFWYELARLEGVKYSPRHRPLRWGRYIMMFVYDAVDEEVGKVLREKNPKSEIFQKPPSMAEAAWTRKSEQSNPARHHDYEAMQKHGRIPR